MAAGLGFKTFTTGEVLTAADVNGYLMQGVLVFASEAARNAAITSPQEGQFAYTKDNNSLWYYTGSAWAASGATGDIEGVTAGTGLTGGGTSGTVTLNFDVANYGGGSYAAGKNKIINGDFNINQRNVSSTTSNDAFIFDRWSMIGVGGTTTTSSQTFTPGTAPVSGYEGNTFIRQAITGQTLQTEYAGIRQKIEDVRTFAGQTVTVSFWAKASSGTPYLWVEEQQFFGTGGSPSTTTTVQMGSTIQLNTSWTRYSVTKTVGSLSGKTIGTTANTSALQIVFWTSLGSSIRAYANATFQNATIDLWGVQIEAGSVATPFSTATGTLAGELAACQRYYFRVTPGDAGRSWGVGYATNTTRAEIGIHFPVTMRTRPTALEQSGTASDYSVGYSTTDSVCSVVPAYFNGNEQFMFVSFTVASGLTAQAAVRGRSNAAGAYLAWSAEL